MSKAFSNIQFTMKEEEMSEKDWFKPGDKVKVVDGGRSSRFKNGDILTVVRQNRGDNVSVLADGEEGTGQGGFYPWRFQLVDSLASTIAAVKKGDRVTVRTKATTYAEFEVGDNRWGAIVSVGGEVYIRNDDITELTITKPALPTEPGVGAIVKFQNVGGQQWQIHSREGWLPIYSNGSFSNAPFDWEKTFNQFGPEFEVIREGDK